VAWRNVYSPHVNVVLPDLPSTYWVRDMTCWLAEQSHQVVELTVAHVLNTSIPSQEQVSPAGTAVWAEGSPVHLQYGWWSDDNGDFYGYVASSRVQASERDDRFGYAVVVPVVYTLVGASMPMQSRVNRSWSDVSPSYLATSIATSHNFQPQVDVSTVRYTSRMQTQSDWGFLADLTSRVGYRLFLDGTVLWFVNRRTVMPARDGSVPVMRQDKTPGVVNSLREFTSIVGDTDPAGGIRAQFQTSALNAVSGVRSQAVFTQTRTGVQGNAVAPLVTQQYSGHPAGSYTEAATLLDGDTPYLWVEARAVTNGDSRLKPGSLIDIEGSGVGSENTGLWMVRAATHTLAINHASAAKTEYTCTLVLGRDDARSLALPVQQAVPTMPPTTLVAGRWRSQYLKAA
jgi:hypothetical protein